VFRITSKIQLRKTSAILGHNTNSRDGIAVNPSTSVIDATAIADDVVLAGPGNSVGVRLEGFRLVLSATPTPSNCGIDPGGFATMPVLRNVNITQGYCGITLSYVQGASIENVWTDLQANVGLDIVGGGPVSITNALFANVAGAGWSPANLRVRSGASDILLLTPVTDEGFNGAASLLVLDARRVTVVGTHLFYTHGGYGVRLGDGISNPTDCTLLNVSVTRFAAAAPPKARIELHGSRHTLINVVTDSDDGGPRIVDLASGTTMVNADGMYRFPSLPSSDPGSGSNQLWYDPSDGNRVKFAP
jgi:hypothetical protein